MERIRTVDAMQTHAEAARADGQSLALVPTLGALHDGHLALVRTALEAADHVTVSVFVNPTQFGPGEDYDAYPRDLEGDREKLEALGVDALFAPSVEEMYPYVDDAALPGPLAWVSVDRLDEHLCGAHREGHFRGVTTVVTKLFNACKPDIGVFGTKDAQQYVILQRMVEDLLFDIEIVGVPTVREPDGLARSSRNDYLDPNERKQATVLYEAVTAAEEAIERGEQEAQSVVRAMENALAAAPDADVQYAEVVDAHTLQPVEHLAPGQEILAAVAVFFGDTRLIDNTFVHVPRS
ncbi:MAG: pantoate--beta-alanine ligase [Bacteroidetes bacterium QH_10_64_37]|jgi:pantoate--beta-alanine ligase|nr:MAG: pantoate--beta-alanine ligase [Bacteroidetes bacterium QH_10_64_37]